VIFGKKDPTPLYEDLKKLSIEIVVSLDQLNTHGSLGRSLASKYMELIEHNAITFDILRGCSTQIDNKEAKWIRRALCSKINTPKKLMLERIFGNMQLDDKILSELESSGDLYSLAIQQAIKNFKSIGQKEALKRFFVIDFNEKSNTDALESQRKLYIASLQFVISSIGKYLHIFASVEELQMSCQEIARKIKMDYSKNKKPVPEEIEEPINYLEKTLPSKIDFGDLKKWTENPEVFVKNLSLFDLEQVAKYLEIATKYFNEYEELYEEYEKKKKTLEAALNERNFEIA
jgi:hypothetical protein